MILHVVSHQYVFKLPWIKQDFKTSFGHLTGEWPLQHLREDVL